MSQRLPPDINRLLTALETDIGELYADSTLSEFWLLFSARVARIRSLAQEEDVRQEISRRIDQMVARLDGFDRRRHH